MCFPFEGISHLQSISAAFYVDRFHHVPGTDNPENWGNCSNPQQSTYLFSGSGVNLKTFYSSVIDITFVSLSIIACVLREKLKQK